ncbi:calcium uniporter protein, mitochondrial [Neocloeon triangulifer]|uniref:calcium uniporter protein, mitochondrial n=1 Tax=Neocloeon triangulifer TaxID=2078957 RepID=UPI00286F4BF0|nr:calcium uniporter protein, mitochondrial [Neocloeon triangulifer]
MAGAWGRRVVVLFAAESRALRPPRLTCKKNFLMQPQVLRCLSTSLIRPSSESPIEPNLVKATPAQPSDGGITIHYSQGLPVVTVPLPSRKERCRFTLRPISHSVGDFQEMLKKEDKGIDRVACTTLEGVRIASSNTIESLMENDFCLVMNDVSYTVVTPHQERLSQEEIKQLSDVRNLVNQLYEALNVGEHQLSKERELFSQLEVLKEQIQPFEAKKIELAQLAEKRTTTLTWVGLGLMSVQFGILARLTWWEYSWDIMEPVTYFVTYGTAMAAYAYFVLTKQEYLLPDVKDRQFLISFHKKAKKNGFDVQRYNELREGIASVERDLRRLRDPLQIHLPPSHLQEASPEPHISPLARAQEQIRSLLKRKF